MTMEQTKVSLRALVEDEGNKVVALSGLWGTGKSHLWSEVRSSSSVEKISGALYVSLFGVKDIGDLKLRAIQSALPKVGDNVALAEGLRKVWATAGEVLKKVHPAFSALDELALVGAPALLSGRLIVIDDIERRNEKLGIDEVLGFIDEYTRQYGSRMLLILNSERVGETPLWETMREKVIDREIRLEPAPAEAFEIARGARTPLFEAHILEAAVACELTNIRIVRKVIRLVETIVSGHPGITEAIARRVVPSAVLLAAIHYKGIADGPDFEYVLEFGGSARLLAALKRRDAAQPEDTKQGERRARWALLMEKLGIRGADEYEGLVVDFLRSGSLDATALGAIVERYVNEADRFRAEAMAGAFGQRFAFHPNLSDAELLEDARALVGMARHLDMFTVTSLHGRIEKLAGGSAVAAEFIDSWIAFYRVASKSREFGLADFPNQPVHPAILAEFEIVKESSVSLLDLRDVIASINQREAWSAREESRVSRATAEEFEKIIMSLEGQELKMFMLNCAHLYAGWIANPSNFSGALAGFMDACKSICEREGPDSRWSAMVRLVLADANLLPRLDSIDPTA